MKTINDITGSVYLTCSACMSVYADALSWANENFKRVVFEPDQADNIIVLSCQVTGLAILNDFRLAEDYQRNFPHTFVFISGCLSQREDIIFPNGIGRLEQMRGDNDSSIDDKDLVNFEAPFWVPDFKESDCETDNGNIFRNMYPLRIGKGCMFNCTYCTIKITRGKHAVYGISYAKEKEFKEKDNILLVADSPTSEQIKNWCNLAIFHKKPFSIRNVEPHIVIQSAEYLVMVARAGLLKIFHSPIQSNNKNVLKNMNRGVNATLQTIELSRLLKSFGTVIATNVIIDYKHFPNDFDEIYRLYDYVSWNPYFDGKFDREKESERFSRYIGTSCAGNQAEKR